MHILYVFIDISGDFIFSKGCSKYLVFTAILCNDICPGVLELHKMRHELITDKGLDISRFHAHSDKKSTRYVVYKIIRDLSNLRIDNIIIEKCKTNPTLQSPSILYPMIIKYLLSYPFDNRGMNAKQYDQVCVFADAESRKKHELRAMKDGVKTFLSSYLGGMPYKFCMHNSGTHYYLQIADYCGWAIFRKWEMKDQEFYKLIRPIISSEFDIFGGGISKYY